MDIHEHARRGDRAAVERDLDAGVPVDILDPDTGLTPLAAASSSPDGNRQTLELLLARGADPNAVCGTWRKQSILLGAVARKNVDCLEVLLRAGADATYRDGNGYDALISAFYGEGAQESRVVATVRLLLAHGAPIDGRTSYDETAVTVASRFGYFEAVRLLIDAGADASELGWTPLHRAVALGTPSDVEAAISEADLEARDGWSRTPWLLSMCMDDMAKARALASAGADVNARMRGGHTALHFAVECRHLELVGWLLQLGLDVDLVDDTKTTALMVAARKGASDIVRRLLDTGANPMAVNEFGDTAMLLAGTLEVARVLEAGGGDPADIGEPLRRALTGVAPREFACSEEEFNTGWRRVFGTANPERMATPFWRAMVEARAQAHAGRRLFHPDLFSVCPIWCYSRFGQSITELGDGRVVEIGGEHEDYYDPDFCIYNDVVVSDGAGGFTIYGYPREVFPPTDFHTATPVEGWIYVIGSLGYEEERRPGRAAVFRLSTSDFHIEPVESRGDDPGWISRHRARLVGPDTIRVSGGKLHTNDDYVDHARAYEFDVRSHAWRLVRDDGPRPGGPR